MLEHALIDLASCMSNGQHGNYFLKANGFSIQWDGNGHVAALEYKRFRCWFREGKIIHWFWRT